MKNNKKIYFLVFALLIFGGFYWFLNPANCYGDKCEVQNNNTKSFTEFPEMNPVELEEKLKNEEIYLLDIREEVEWNAGRIANANFLPLGMINIENTKDIPKDKPVYVYCRTGNRAKEGTEKLRSLGFDAYNIGGIVQYIERGGKLVK